MTVTYTTAAKVWAYLQRGDTLGTASIPSQTTVEMYINWAESEIERRTNRAYQAVTESNEIHTMKFPSRSYFGHYIHKPYIVLNHAPVRTLTAATDYLYVWNGSSWVDWVATKTEGRGNDYWVDTENGYIFFNKGYNLLDYPDNVKVTYRWGGTTVPKWCEELATMMAAVRVLEFDRDRVISAEGGSGDAVDFPRVDTTIASMKQEIERRLDENSWLNRKRKFVITG